MSPSLSVIYFFRSKVTHSDGSCHIKSNYTLITGFLPHHMRFDNEFRRTIEAQCRGCLTFATFERERMACRKWSKKVSVRRLMVNRLQTPSLGLANCQNVATRLLLDGEPRRKVWGGRPRGTCHGVPPPEEEGRDLHRTFTQKSRADWQDAAITEEARAGDDSPGARASIRCTSVIARRGQRDERDGLNVDGHQGEATVSVAEVVRSQVASRVRGRGSIKS